MREDKRSNLECRELKFEANFMQNSLGSVLVSLNNTKVLCSVNLEDRVPKHVAASSGWLTAEYAMLPGSTDHRKRRAILQNDKRSVEIQRLIGRSLRAVVNLDKLGPKTLYIDCDVLQADGSTRCTSIIGANYALNLALYELKRRGLIENLDQIKPCELAAVSVGIVDGEILVDLCQSEDNRAEVDMNVVGTKGFNLIEIQGTAEKKTFSKSLAKELIDRAMDVIEDLIDIQLKSLSSFNNN